MLAFILAVALIGGGAAALYFLVIKKQQKSTSVLAPTASWQFQYSSNVSGTPDSFDFPATDGVHYCIKAPPPLAQGQTVKLSFTLTGTGTRCRCREPRHILASTFSARGIICPVLGLTSNIAIFMLAFLWWWVLLRLPRC